MRMSFENILRRADRAPMLKALVPLVAGIVVAGRWSLPVWGAAAGLAVSVAGAFVLRRWTAADICIAAAMFFAGWCAVEVRPAPRAPEGERVMEIVVDEVLSRRGGETVAEGRIAAFAADGGVERCGAAVRIWAAREVALGEGERVEALCEVRPFAADGYGLYMSRRGVAGTVFQVVQWFYLRFQVGVSSYNAIYGGLAALPLLLVWLQLSWSIVLWGTELCYIMRNRHVLYRDALGANKRWVEDVDVSVKMLKIISDTYTHHQGGPTLAVICKKLRMSSSKARIVLQELVDLDILVEVKDEDDVSYYPAVDFHHLSMSDIIIRLAHLDKNKGEKWKVRFVEAIKKEFSADTFA